MVKRKFLVACFFACLILAPFIAGPVCAQEPSGGIVEIDKIVSEQDDIDIKETIAKKGPVEVLVGLYILDISKIDDLNQTFSVDFHIKMQWKDPALSERSAQKKVADGRITIDETWNPKIQILNQHGLTKHFSDIVTIDSEGTITYRQRFSGSLSAPLDLRGFPLDSHVLPINIASFYYGPDEVKFVVDRSNIGRAEKFSIADWSVGEDSIRVSPYYFAPQDNERAQLIYEVKVARKAGFYFLRVVFPLMIIVFMSWVVFWIDPSDLGSQVAIAATSILTLVVFQFSLGDLLPKISYLTRIDKFIQISSIFIFFTLLEAIATSRFAKKGKRDLALKVDFWSRIAYPLFFFLLMIYAWR